MFPQPGDWSIGALTNSESLFDPDYFDKVHRNRCQNYLIISYLLNIFSDQSYKLLVKVLLKQQVVGTISMQVSGECRPANLPDRK